MNKTVSVTKSSIHWQYLTREMGLILLWVFIILVAGTVTGLINYRIQVASTILGVAVLGSWLIRLIIHRRKVPLTGIEWGLVAFMVAQLITVLYSQDVRRGLPSLLMYGVFILVYYFISDLVHRKWPIELIEKTLLIVGGIVVGLALFQLWGDYSIWRNIVADLPYAPSFEYRLYAIFGDANLLAAFVNILIPISIGRILSSRKIIPAIPLSGLLVGILVIVYFSSSRGGVLGDLAAISVFIIGWVKFVSDRARELVLKIWSFLRSHPIILGLIALAVAAPVVFVLMKVLQFQGDATHGPILSSRTAFWGAAWEAFSASPWVGTGPGTYPSAYILHNAVPPDRPYLHAHSVPFTIASESGLLGLAGLAIFLFVVARVIWASRLDLSSKAQIRWVSIAAALVGFCVHSLVDNHLPYSSVGITITVLLALLIAQKGADTQRDERDPPITFSVLWLLVPALLIAAFSIYSLRAYWDNEVAIEAAVGGDWLAATTSFDRAIDNDPWLAHYWLQGGYAYGVLAAEGNQVAVQKALVLTEKGIVLEPGYALNYGNLAALYWQAGNADLAILNISRAIELEPQVPIFWLNLGLYAEALALDEDSRHAFNKLLDLQPNLAEMDFWTRTTLRSKALSSWRESHPKDSSSETLVTRGRTATAQSDFSTAEELFVEAWGQSDQKVSLYLGLSELGLAQGNIDQAEKYLHAALWIQGISSNAEKVAPLLALAEINHLRGDSDAALLRYRQVYEALTEYTIYGWATKGWNPYSWFVFQRRSLPIDILPQVVRPPLPPDLVERLLPLVDLHRAAGEVDRADEVHRQLMGLRD